MVDVQSVFLGSSPKMQKMMEMAKGLCTSKNSVLIIGEEGSGKKNYAQYLHQQSPRKDMPFVVVDCSRDAMDVQQDILGYRDQQGKFIKGALERANTGTVVFAHVDALDESFQKKLFTILNELSDYDIDVKIISTSTKNLTKLVASNKFFRSLFLLISNAQVVVPNLKERKEDIPLIVAYYVDYFSKQFGMGSVDIDAAAMDKMVNQSWTGNVRELMQSLQHAMRNCVDDRLDLNALEAAERRQEIVAHEETSEDALRLMTLRDAEKLLIRKALIHTSENRTQAARILGVSIRTLRNKINEYRNEGAQYFLNLR